MRPTLADYLANPDAFPEIARAGSTMPRGRRLPQREAPGDQAMRSRTGAPAPTRYERAPPVLPPSPIPRDLPRMRTPPVEPMRKPGFPIGPGGVLTAPQSSPDAFATTPGPTRYSSMQEAQLANAMMAEPMAILPDSLMPMPEPQGFASGTQPNGMRVPPAPASFGAPPTTGMGLFGKNPGAMTDERWRRALEQSRVADGKRPVTLQDQLFAAIIGGPRSGNVRR